MRYKASEMFQISELQTDSFWDLRMGEGPLKAFALALEKRVTTSELPKPTMNNITAGVHGYEFEIPGTVNYKATVSMTFIEPVDMQVAQSIDQWLKKIYDFGDGDVRGIQTVKHQKLFQDFDLIPRNREDIDSSKFTAKKAILNDWDPGGSFADGNSPDIWKPSISFTVNWYAWEPLGLTPS
jgi:hypothetical protein